MSRIWPFVDAGRPWGRRTARPVPLGEAEIARGYLRDAQAVIDSISDVGVMREQHAELMMQMEALQPGTDSAADEEFTEREIEVLAMLPSPLTTKEIGEELFVSRNTIKTHLRRIYRKLNASSREEAVLIARDRGLLPARDDRQPSSSRPQLQATTTTRRLTPPTPASLPSTSKPTGAERAAIGETT